MSATDRQTDRYREKERKKVLRWIQVQSMFVKKKEKKSSFTGCSEEKESEVSMNKKTPLR